MSVSVLPIPISYRRRKGKRNTSFCIHYHLRCIYTLLVCGGGEFFSVSLKQKKVQVQFFFSILCSRKSIYAVEKNRYVKFFKIPVARTLTNTPKNLTATRKSLTATIRRYVYYSDSTLQEFANVIHLEICGRAFYFCHLCKKNDPKNCCIWSKKNHNFWEKVQKLSESSMRRTNVRVLGSREIGQKFPENNYIGKVANSSESKFSIKLSPEWFLWAGGCDLQPL